MMPCQAAVTAQWLSCKNLITKLPLQCCCIHFAAICTMPQSQYHHPSTAVTSMHSQWCCHKVVVTLHLCNQNTMLLSQHQCHNVAAQCHHHEAQCHHKTMPPAVAMLHYKKRVSQRYYQNSSQFKEWSKTHLNSYYKTEHILITPTSTIFCTWPKPMCGEKVLRSCT